MWFLVAFMMTNKTLLAKAGGSTRTFVDRAAGAVLEYPGLAPSAEKIHAPARYAIEKPLA